ncbi:MAG: glycerol-3-phosphate 1-O-acyltransferase PlsY [Ruminococcaceae bacterium]|nr:glycerol-3-phosphate 1-O-acyltransferase PlsY [Oscillospiraceae bacterium]
MEIFLAGVITAVVSYLLGSINFAIIFSKIFKKDDVRRHGSGNAGMTNVLRTYGAALAIPTLLGDFLKGVAAVMIGKCLFEYFAVTVVDGQYVAGLFVLLGHVFPLFFKFRGGKGAMTSLGIMVIIDYRAFLVVIGIAMIVLLASKYVSLASISGAVVYPIITCILMLSDGPFLVWNEIFAIIFAIIVISKHHENIGRLMKGTESKLSLGKKKKNSETAEKK